MTDSQNIEVGEVVEGLRFEDEDVREYAWAVKGGEGADVKVANLRSRLEEFVASRKQRGSGAQFGDEEIKFLEDLVLRVEVGVKVAEERLSKDFF